MESCTKTVQFDEMGSEYEVRSFSSSNPELGVLEYTVLNTSKRNPVQAGVK